MRTGVNTGDVVASRDARAEVGMVTGDAVNAAARLEQTADAGRSSSRSGRLARPAGFRFSDVGPLAVRGKSRPVATVELLDEGLDELPGGRNAESPGCARRWSAATTSSSSSARPTAASPRRAVPSW